MDFDKVYPQQNADWRMICAMHEYSPEHGSCSCQDPLANWGPIDTPTDALQAYAFYTLHLANFGMKMAYILGQIDAQTAKVNP